MVFPVPLILDAGTGIYRSSCQGNISVQCCFQLKKKKMFPEKTYIIKYSFLLLLN